MHCHFYLRFRFKNLEAFCFWGFLEIHPAFWWIGGDLNSQPPPYPLLGPTSSHYLFGFNVAPTLWGWLSAQMVHCLRTRNWSRLLACHGMLQCDPEANWSGRGGSRWDRAAGTLWRQLRVRREYRLTQLKSGRCIRKKKTMNLFALIEETTCCAIRNKICCKKRKWCRSKRDRSLWKENCFYAYLVYFGLLCFDR